MENITFQSPVNVDRAYQVLHIIVFTVTAQQNMADSQSACEDAHICFSVIRVKEQVLFLSSNKVFIQFVSKYKHGISK